MLLAALYIIAPKGKQPVLKTIQIDIHQQVTIQMLLTSKKDAYGEVENLKIIILSETSPAPPIKKGTCCIILFV